MTHAADVPPKIQMSRLPSMALREKTPAVIPTKSLISPVSAPVSYDLTELRVLKDFRLDDARHAFARRFERDRNRVPWSAAM